MSTHPFSLGACLMWQTMRYLAARNEASGGEPLGHSHSHSHSHGTTTTLSTEKNSEGLRKRKGGADEVDTQDAVVKATSEGGPSEVNPSLQLGAYLNLFADWVHNVTDGQTSILESIMCR